MLCLASVLDYPVEKGGTPDPFDEIFMRILSKIQKRQQDAPGRQPKLMEGAKDVKVTKKQKEKETAASSAG